MAGEVGAFVIGTDVIGGSGAGALPGSFNVITGATPPQGVVSIDLPSIITVVRL